MPFFMLPDCTLLHFCGHNPSLMGPCSEHCKHWSCSWVICEIYHLYFHIKDITTSARYFILCIFVYCLFHFKICFDIKLLRTITKHNFLMLSLASQQIFSHTAEYLICFTLCLIRFLFIQLRSILCSCVLSTPNLID